METQTFLKSAIKRLSIFNDHLYYKILYYRLIYQTFIMFNNHKKITNRIKILLPHSSYSLPSQQPRILAPQRENQKLQSRRKGGRSEKWPEERKWGTRNISGKIQVICWIELLLPFFWLSSRKSIVLPSLLAWSWEVHKCKGKRQPVQAKVCIIGKWWEIDKRVIW